MHQLSDIPLGCQHALAQRTTSVVLSVFSSGRGVLTLLGKPKVPGVVEPPCDDIAFLGDHERAVGTCSAAGKGQQRYGLAASINVSALSGRGSLERPG